MLLEGVPYMNFSKAIVLIILGSLLTACGGNPVKPGDARVNGMITSAYKVSLPDGTDVWHIECPGWGNSWSNCFARADYVCSDGFVLLEQRENAGGVSAVATPYFASAGQRTSRVAIVRCKEK
jgi:hypothetical protein